MTSLSPWVIQNLLQVPAGTHQPGTVIHTLGHPLDSGTYGGGFIYHMADNKVAIGLVIGLDYTNPHLNTFQASYCMSAGDCRVGQRGQMLLALGFKLAIL